MSNVGVFDMREIKKIAEQALELVKEAEQYNKYREGLGKRIAQLFHESRAGSIPISSTRSFCQN